MAQGTADFARWLAQRSEYHRANSQEIESRAFVYVAKQIARLADHGISLSELAEFCRNMSLGADDCQTVRALGYAYSEVYHLAKDVMARG